jgi:hypothetical protein
MVGCALSEHVKKQKKCRALNAHMQQAVEAYQWEQTQPPDKRKGVRKIDDKFFVNYTTLLRLAKGGISMSTFNASKQKLILYLMKSTCLLIISSPLLTEVFHSHGMTLRSSPMVLFKDGRMVQGVRMLWEKTGLLCSWTVITMSCRLTGVGPWIHSEHVP